MSTLTFDVRTNVADTIAELGRQFQRIPAATVQALNATADVVQANQVAEMRKVYDRPTPWTLGGVYTKRATQSQLTATVGLKDSSWGGGTAAASYLAPTIAGGLRGPKPYEGALRAVGALPPGYLTVPGAGAQIDSYGNMNRGEIVAILSYFSAFPESGYKANVTFAGRMRLARGTKRRLGYSYFVGAPGGGRLPLGIWKRVGFTKGSAVVPI